MTATENVHFKNMGSFSVELDFAAGRLYYDSQRDLKMIRSKRLVNSAKLLAKVDSYDRYVCKHELDRVVVDPAFIDLLGSPKTGIKNYYQIVIDGFDTAMVTLSGAGAILDIVLQRDFDNDVDFARFFEHMNVTWLKGGLDYGLVCVPLCDLKRYYQIGFRLAVKMDYLWILFKPTVDYGDKYNDAMVELSREFEITSAGAYKALCNVFATLTPERCELVL